MSPEQISIANKFVYDLRNSMKTKRINAPDIAESSLYIHKSAVYDWTCGYSYPCVKYWDDIKESTGIYPGDYFATMQDESILAFRKALKIWKINNRETNKTIASAISNLVEYNINSKIVERWVNGKSGFPGNFFWKSIKTITGIDPENYFLGKEIKEEEISSFGEALLNYRVEREVRGEQAVTWDLAKEFGYTIPTIDKWINGEKIPPEKIWPKIKEKTGIDPEKYFSKKKAKVEEASSPEEVFLQYESTSKIKEKDKTEINSECGNRSREKNESAEAKRKLLEKNKTELGKRNMMLAERQRLMDVLASYKKYSNDALSRMLEARRDYEASSEQNSNDAFNRMSRASRDYEFWVKKVKFTQVQIEEIEREIGE